MNLWENPYPALCVMRSFVIAHRLGFAIGPSLIEYIVSHNSQVDIDESLDIQKRHYSYTFIDGARLHFLNGAIRDHYRTKRYEALYLPSTHTQQLDMGFDVRRNVQVVRASRRIRQTAPRRTFRQDKSRKFDPKTDEVAQPIRLFYLTLVTTL